MDMSLFCPNKTLCDSIYISKSNNMDMSLFWPSKKLCNSIYISKITREQRERKNEGETQTYKEAMGMMDMSTSNMVSVL